MGCGCELVVSSSSKDAAVGWVEQAAQEILRIENKYSRYLPESIVSRINAAAGAIPVVCDDETLALFGCADSLFEQSGGLFDITSGVLRDAWDFSKAELPGKSRIDRLLPLIGWDMVERDGCFVRLPREGMQIDFGGVGKEYAADCVVRLLQQQGACHGFLNMSGDIRVIGAQPGGEPWIIGVRDPANEAQTIASIPLYEGALATSGDYERYFDIDGRRYCHLLHPSHGYPVDFWRSVTVAAPLAVTAGSISTIAMLKEAEGLDYLRSTGMKFLAVERYGKTHYRN